MRQVPHRSLLVLLAVLPMAAMLGCQGISSHTNDTQPPPAGQLSASPASVTFGNVSLGTSQTLSNTLTNTGTASLDITAATVDNASFTLTGLSLPITLAAGQTTSFNIVFQPQSTGSVSGNLSLTNTGTNALLTVPLSGTGVLAGALATNPASFSFGTVVDGANATQTETLQNSGAASITISQANVTGTGFSVTGLSLPLTLAAGQSSSFGVKFAPTAPGAVSGQISLTISGTTTTADIALSGTGAPPALLTPSPSGLTFTNITAGQNSTQTETLTNTGGVNTSVSAATVAGTGFSISGFSPVTLTPGQSTTFSVKFAPASAGTFSGNVTVTSDASNPSLSIPLSGTAVATATLTATPTSLTYTNITVGQNSSQTETIKNTGGTSATISAAAASGTGFSISGITPPVTLTPGQSTSFTVTFAPTSAGTFSGSVTVSSNASNPSLSIPLSGTAVVSTSPALLTATPSSLTYTNIIVGQNSSQTETIKNTGGTSATISAAAASGTGFSISGITPPVTLNPGQSTSFTVKFAPTTAGTFSGSVTITSDASNPTLSIPLSGTAVAASAGTLTANPVTVAIPGNVVVGTSGTATGQLTAAGGSVTISSVNVIGSEFVISGLSFPVTLTTGQSATYTVTFTPTASGSASTTASFASNATNAPTGVTLTGTAIPAPVHTVNLSWTASSPSTGVSGYYIYRALYNTSTSKCGAYTKQNPSSPNVPTTYTDSNNITDGDTYCYQVTAVNSAGEESTDSNMAEAIIPAP